MRENYQMEQVKADCTLRQETLRQRLEFRKKQTEALLADVNEALKFLDNNPNFEAFHNLIGKAGF